MRDNNRNKDKKTKRDKKRMVKKKVRNLLEGKDPAEWVHDLYETVKDSSEEKDEGRGLKEVGK